MYIDAHNHLDFYEDRLSTAIDIIRKNSILTLACAMDEQSYLSAKMLSNDNPLIIPCFGVHPSKARECGENWDKYEEYLIESRVIGEIGLDFHWIEDRQQYPAQIELLEFFLGMAKKHGKVTNLHTKGAEQEILALLKKHSVKPPIIHWYSGPFDIMKELLDYGCYFTVGVDLGYSQLTAELVQSLPLDRLLTETDGPTALEWVNGQYGYPDYVKTIVQGISILKNLPEDDVQARIYENFEAILK